MQVSTHLRCFLGLTNLFSVVPAVLRAFIELMFDDLTRLLNRWQNDASLLAVNGVRHQSFGTVVHYRAKLSARVRLTSRCAGLALPYPAINQTKQTQNKNTTEHPSG